ncbi:target of rapamycin complex subunit LST8-like isoform X2 [Papaver somniferum]|uniref:target of rapamycin complex subunit LST8-like isoform X2 n=1 Tax=Papaver somniferum TaxID=3469 RepID=UPI000E6FDBE7|nr:target of rapamycin complex subunit LST8-like isoform X2 [Papaver somniferum]
MLLFLMWKNFSRSAILVPEVDTAVRSVTVMWDESLVVAANNNETCYVWRLQRGTQTMTNFEPLHKLQAHDGYILKCLLSPGHIARASIIFIVDEGENSVKAQVFI